MAVSIIQLTVILALRATLAAPPGDAIEVWEGDWALVQTKKSPSQAAPWQVPKVMPEIRPEEGLDSKPEEPTEEVEDYQGLLRVDWTLYSESRSDFLPTELETARRQRSQRFKDALCDPTRRDHDLEEEEKKVDRCCAGGNEAANRCFQTDNLFVACSNSSVSFDRDTLCSLYYTICCEQTSLKKFYVQAVNKHKPKRDKKKKQSKKGN